MKEWNERIECKNRMKEWKIEWKNKMKEWNVRIERKNRMKEYNKRIQWKNIMKEYNDRKAQCIARQYALVAFLLLEDKLCT